MSSSNVLHLLYLSRILCILFSTTMRISLVLYVLHNVWEGINNSGQQYLLQASKPDVALALNFPTPARSWSTVGTFFNKRFRNPFVHSQIKNKNRHATAIYILDRFHLVWCQLIIDAPCRLRNERVRRRKRSSTDVAEIAVSHQNFQTVVALVPYGCISNSVSWPDRTNDMS